jgi:uncharacterized protein (DUF2141 family)
MYYKVISISILLLITAIILGCANVVAPSGGDGIKTIPVVVCCSANNGLTNFNKKNISIEFNSYMNRNVVIENLQISPAIKYSYKWSAKTLTITFIEELKTNTTYSIFLGGKYSDYYGNTAENPFYTCFSTGDIIDSCKISGKLFTTNTDGYYIFCYSYRDSINYLKDIPEYKTLVGGNGIFIIPALKDGKYIVLAVKDIDKDGVITQLKDTIGIPQFVSEITNCLSKNVELIPNYVLDTIQPNLIECKTITTNQILIIFSEPMSKDNVSNQSFYIFNENVEKMFPSKIEFIRNNTEQLLLTFDSIITKNYTWKLCLNSNITLKDKNNNPMRTLINIDVVNETDSILKIDTTESESQSDSVNTKDTNNYLHFGGKVIDTNAGKNKYLVITQAGRDFSKKVKVNDDNTFMFENILAGDYEIFYFIDLNSNAIFDKGKLIPFEFSESFHKIEQKVKLNPRWSIDDYIIEIK